VNPISKPETLPSDLITSRNRFLWFAAAKKQNPREDNTDDEDQMQSSEAKPEIPLNVHVKYQRRRDWKWDGFWFARKTREEQNSRRDWEI